MLFRSAAALLRRLDYALDLKLNLASADAQASSFEGQVAEAVSRSPDVASYVHQLEEQARAEEESQVEPGPPPAELPSSDVLVQELEDFLRRRREGGEDSQPTA